MTPVLYPSAMELEPTPAPLRDGVDNKTSDPQGVPGAPAGTGWAAPGVDDLVAPGRPCSWCAVPFMTARRPGRPRLYCRDACKQRAYEHRHGLRHVRTVRSLPGQIAGDVWYGSGYERGGWGHRDRRTHAMRTSVRPDGRRRETLCGAVAVPMAGQYFLPSASTSCATCRSIVAANPLELGISPSNELSLLRAVIDEATEGRVTDAEALRWLRARQPPRTQPIRAA